LIQLQKHGLGDFGQLYVAAGMCVLNGGREDIQMLNLAVENSAYA
jgi:hypothetical protein